MSDTVKLNQCPKCGVPIPAEAPQGLCPKCVLVGAAIATETGLPATATSEIPSLERVAAAFPQLEVLELIGRGGMGFVFKARQPHLDRFVALKLLPDKLARDPRFAERFNREGRVLARLNHPNIVSVYDFGQTEHFYFLLMEFVDGVNLRQAMKAGRFSPAEALAIVPKICEALQYAHGQGILHRDIKPENILLDSRGHVKIADFGIAKLVGEEKPDVALTATGASIGTPHYMAPEQLEQPLTVDHRADIYSLGVVFYEMLTGELPIGRFAAPSSKTPVGTAVDEVVFRTLEKDRERRYQSAGEMKTQVEHLGESGGATSQPVPPNLAGSGRGVDVPKWSQKAVWGAVLTGLSIPLPMLMAVIVYFRLAGLAGVELLIGAGSIGLPGLVGTILGWMALSDIRAHQGRLRGLPLAVFAALAYPLLMLLGATLVIPWVLSQRGGGGGPGPMMPLAGLLIMLIPLGLITFGIWAVYAAARWGANKPPTRRRGVLKWVFLGMAFAAIGGLAALNFLQGKASQETDEASDGRGARAIDQNLRSIPEPIRINFRGAPGQVVAFQINRWDGGGPSPLPGFAGYYRMPDNRPGSFSVVLNPQSLGKGQPRRWDISAIPEDGPVARGGSLPLGNVRRALPANSVSVVPPNSSMAVTLTENVVHAAGQEPIPQLTVDVFSTASPQEFPDQASIRLGSTNWGQGLRETGTADATPWIRFTFTAVELREISATRWLALDYVDDVHGDCQKAFPWETTIPGFKAETRTSQFVKSDKDSPVVRHQRIEYRMPDSAPREQLDRLRENLGQALKQKSIRLELSEQQAPVLLFELPGADGGSLKAWVKVVPPLKISTDAASASFGPVEQAATPPSDTHKSAHDYVFGPVAVRTLSFNESLQDGFLDLETARLLTPPKDIAALFKTAFGKRVEWEDKSAPQAAKMREWLQTSGANLMAWGGEYGERLEIREGVAIQPPWTGTNRVSFDQTDPNVVARQADVFLKPLLTNSTIKIYLMQPGYDSKLGQRQDTFQFLTREGTIGVLQILNLVDNPPGVQFRYKLVQETSARAP